ncbi:MAG: formate--phosphoribosylaminoimidazolecarboxamide ligase [Thermoplasmata archaeon]|nr:formate--phosphoribosylaminoimidazolecarboxamide ligase [Thermoplasmata archaeon]
MISKGIIAEILQGYGEDLTVATVCSHSSLQIFDGARKEGFKTIGIAIEKPPKYYDAFPKGKPDEFLIVDNYSQILERSSELAEKNAVVIPHGSFVEYLGAQRFTDLDVPTFGNRKVLEWESNRNKEREWLTSAGLSMPKEITNPEEINVPVLVKYHGAKGGRGFFIAKDYEDFKAKRDPNEEVSIQEYVVGTRYYMHYFYSPISDGGYKLSKGSLEFLSIDRRDESNVDGLYRMGNQDDLRKMGIDPTFVVTGNSPLVLRESLLPKAFAIGEQTVERSLELFGGMIGPFSLETIVTDDLEFKVFEISARIVAGTNLFVSGSPYADLLDENMSTGRRIARELRIAKEKNLLMEVLS